MGWCNLRMQNKIITLSEVFTGVDQLNWKFALYLPAREKWGLESHCAVLDPDECGPDEDEPEFAKANSLRYALTIQQIRGVVLNVRQQKSNATFEELLRAFLFYYDHDAFLDLSKS